jgi:hypothetical protein
MREFLLDFLSHHAANQKHDRRISYCKGSIGHRNEASVRASELLPIYRKRPSLTGRGGVRQVPIPDIDATRDQSVAVAE